MVVQCCFWNLQLFAFLPLCFSGATPVEVGGSIKTSGGAPMEVKRIKANGVVPMEINDNQHTERVLMEVESGIRAKGGAPVEQGKGTEITGRATMDDGGNVLKLVEDIAEIGSGVKTIGGPSVKVGGSVKTSKGTAIETGGDTLITDSSSVTWEPQAFSLQADGELDEETCLILFLKPDATNVSNDNESISNSSTDRFSSPNKFTSGNDRIPRSISSPGTTVGASEALEEFTLCVAFSFSFFNKLTALVSYATKDTDNMIFIGVGPNFTEVMIGGSVEVVETNTDQDTWYLLCLMAWPGGAALYSGTRLLHSWSRESSPLPLDGVLVVGQDQDTLGGGFSLNQAFQGKVSLLLMWPRQLAMKEVGQVASCHHTPPEGAIFPWTSPPWQPQGRVQSISTSHCRQPPWNFYLFQEPLTFKAATARLTKLGMTLVTPGTGSHKEHLKQVIAGASSLCSRVFTSNRYVMVNLIFNQSSNTATDLLTNTSVHVDVDSHATHDSVEVSHLKMSGDGYLSTTVTGRYCYVGEYLGPRPLFFLRGLCTDSDTEISTYYKHFTLLVSASGEMYFAGLYYLCLRQVGTTWRIYHHQKNVTVATTESVSLPIGRRMWNTTGGDPDCSINKGMWSLTLSLCSDDQFTCTDGACVNMTSRCDLTSDCADWSDEKGCDMVRLPEGYISQLPPQLPITFSLRMVIYNIEVHLQQMTVTMELKYTLIWYDNRINFLNLRQDRSTNLVTTQHGDIWRPRIDVTPTVGYDPLQQEPLLTIHRLTPGQLDDDDYIYRGQWNPIQYETRAQPTIRCPFSLKQYPHDEQQCCFNLSITNVKTGNIRYGNCSIDYRGNTTLDEYFVYNWCMNVSHNKGQVSFTLRRRQSHQIWSTYLPTSLLLGISYGTLYIPAKSFSNRGTMSLTTMLVLVSLYTESLSSLPTTAYNKYIDQWYLFIIVYVSLIIVVHLVTSNPRPNAPVPPPAVFSTRRVSAGRGRGHLRCTRRINAHVILKVARVVFGLAYVVYGVHYFQPIFCEEESMPTYAPNIEPKESQKMSYVACSHS